MRHVLVAGAGVAALECVLALRELAGARVAVELLAPAPSSCTAPRPSRRRSAGRPPPASNCDQLAAELGVRLHRDALASVEAGAHHVLTRDGDYVPYDMLVVATGARSREAVPGAMTFRGPMSAGVVEQAVARVAAEPGLRLAFAAPPGVRWLLPLYELALLGAATLRDRGVAEPDIVVVTGEHEPLEVFGPAASEAVRRELDRAGVELVTQRRGRRGARAARSGSRAAASSAPTSSSRCPRWSARASPACRTTTTASSPSTSTAAYTDAPTSSPPATRPRSRSSTAGSRPSRPTRSPRRSRAQVGAVALPEPFRPVLRGLLLTGDGRCTCAPNSVPAASASIALLPLPAPGRTAPSGGRRARSPAAT